MKNAGYILSICFIFLFCIISKIFHFKTGNSIWASAWMILFIVPSLISSYRKREYILHRIIFWILAYALILTIVISLILIFNPNVEYPLY